MQQLGAKHEMGTQILNEGEGHHLPPSGDGSVFIVRIRV